MMRKPGQIMSGEEFDATSGGAAPFQFEDVRKLANKVLASAAQQAKRSLDAAARQAQEIEKAAYDDGYQKGHAKGQPAGHAEGLKTGHAEAKQAFEAKVAGVAESLQAMLDELRTRKVGLQAQAEADLLKLSLEIARRIVRHELSLDPTRVLPVLQEALSLASSRADLVVRIHPSLIAAVESELPRLKTSFADLGVVHLEPDEAVEPGGVLVQTREGEVDLRLSQQFKAFEQALLGEQEAEAPTPAASSDAPAEEALPGPE